MPTASAKEKPLIALAGATATGKSDVALAACRLLGGEIISCDSVQVYRGFDVGCAKPPRAVRAAVRHHLIDVADWSEPFDAARFVRLADAAVTEIRSRGKVPILCGGTGLYLRAFRYGLVDVPAADTMLRAELAAREKSAPGSLYAQLQRVDPDTAAVTEPNNLVQVMRALEITTVAGEPASVVRRRHGFRAPRRMVAVFVLQRERAALRARITARARAMVAAGLCAEVERLLGAGVAPACRPMGAVGYREACAVVRGEAPVAGLAERIATATWHYAKRQQTWFRKERAVEALDADDPQVTAGRVAARIGERMCP